MTVRSGWPPFPEWQAQRGQQLAALRTRATYNAAVMRSVTRGLQRLAHALATQVAPALRSIGEAMGQLAAQVQAARP